MNVIFQSEGNRVKGISFHPKFPWVLCSYYSGDILLFDYVHKMLIHTYVGHDGLYVVLIFTVLNLYLYQAPMIKLLKFGTMKVKNANIL